METLPTAIPIHRPDFAMIGQAQRLAKMAEGYEIDSPELYSAAGEDLTAIKTLQKSIEAKRREAVDPINAGLKVVNDFFREPRSWLENAEATIKQAMVGYQRQIEAKRLEERRASEAAAEIARKAAEAEARKLAEAGKVEEAAAVQAVAQMQIAEAPATAAPAARGISTPKAWVAEIEDPIEVVKFIAANPQYVHWIAGFSKSELNAFAKATRGQQAVPGLRVFEETRIAARAA